MESCCELPICFVCQFFWPPVVVCQFTRGKEREARHCLSLLQVKKNKLKVNTFLSIWLSHRSDRDSKAEWWWFWNNSKQIFHPHELLQRAISVVLCHLFEELNTRAKYWTNYCSWVWAYFHKYLVLVKREKAFCVQFKFRLSSRIFLTHWWLKY